LRGGEPSGPKGVLLLRMVTLAYYGGNNADEGLARSEGEGGHSLMLELAERGPGDETVIPCILRWRGEWLVLRWEKEVPLIWLGGKGGSWTETDDGRGRLSKISL